MHATIMIYELCVHDRGIVLAVIKEVDFHVMLCHVAVPLSLCISRYAAVLETKPSSALFYMVQNRLVPDI